MQVTHSLTSTARRAQILEATIAVVAEEGFARTTYGRIAERAGLSSTRLISYHFAAKDELVSALVAQVVGEIGSHVGGLVMAETTAQGRLAAYINGVVGYADRHRVSMTALLRVLLSGAWGGDPAAVPSETGHLEQIMTAGQEAGEFRDFDVRVMATSLQRAVEGVPLLLQTEPDLDCSAYAAELVELFDRATRAAS